MELINNNKTNYKDLREYIKEKKIDLREYIIEKKNKGV